MKGFIMKDVKVRFTCGNCRFVRNMTCKNPVAFSFMEPVREAYISCDVFDQKSKKDVQERVHENFFEKVLMDILAARK